MQKVPSEAGEVAKRLAQLIFQVLEFLWNWSFGQILAMFRLPLNTLPLWKQMLFVLVLTALGYMFHRISKDFLKALQSVVNAFVGFGTSIIGMLPQIVWRPHRLRRRLDHDQHEPDVDPRGVAVRGAGGETGRAAPPRRSAGMPQVRRR